MLFVYLLETGLLLLVAPWSVFWERNLFVDRLPFIRDVFLNLFTRGAVSGVGLICLAGAAIEIRTLWRRRNQTGLPRPADQTGLRP